MSEQTPLRPAKVFDLSTRDGRRAARKAGHNVPKRPCGVTPILFDARVCKSDGDGDGCWEWTGNKAHGYGSWSLRGQPWRAHRYAWERASGTQIPAGMVVMHKCDNRGCVRPSHLEIGTQLDNRRDAASKGRTARGEKSWNTTLTESEVRAIRANHRRGKRGGEWTTAWIADHYNIHASTVRYISRGSHWKYVAA